MKWITAGNIKNWFKSKKRHCQENLPYLILRLLLAHAYNASSTIDFPSGDSIMSGGWDGVLDTSTVSPFFPSGVSVWEFGTEDSVKKKADEDYNKRTTNPLGYDPKKTTFVFVTPRMWPGKDAWIKEKKAEGKWKDVRVINGSDIEAWLDVSPSVALWLARELSIILNDKTRDLQDFWDEWSLCSTPQLTTDLVYANRATESGKIDKWLSEKPFVLFVQGEDPDEAKAFLYSTLSQMDDKKKYALLSRIVIVDDLASFRTISTSYVNSPLIIMAPSECVVASSSVVSKGHHVYICSDAKLIAKQDLLRLSRPSKKDIYNNLKATGVEDNDAKQIAKDCGGSIAVLRRLMTKTGSMIPDWANDQNTSVLLPLLLIGAWDESKDGDKLIVEVLSGKKYDAYIESLLPLLDEAESPVRKVGNVWKLKSPLDAWYILSKKVTPSILKEYHQAILAVATDTDPKYELPADQRWAAALYEKANPYSGWLRRGLTETLILLAIHGTKSQLNEPAYSFVNRIVREIHINASKWESWSSISDITPLLAESAPQVFLDTLEEMINKNSDLFSELLKDEDSLFDECKHCGLLWALEGLVWNPDYFAQTVNLLYELAAIDANGKWNNRPINTLKDVFRIKYPQTYAKPEDRIKSFKKLCDLNPSIAWKIALGSLLDFSFSDIYKFQWRSSGGVRSSFEPEDTDNHKQYLQGLIPLLKKVSIQKDVIPKALSVFIRLPENFRSHLVTYLDGINISEFSLEVRKKILVELRNASAWIGSYGQGELLKHKKSLARLISKFEPSDPLEKFGWIISTPTPKLPEGLSKNFEENEKLILKAQKKAARKLLDSVKVDELINLGRKSQWPGIVGYSIGLVIKTGSEEAKFVNELIRSDEIPILISGFANARIEIRGEKWVDEILKLPNQKAKFKAAILNAFPESKVIWEKVAKLGKEVEKEYWQIARGRISDDNNTDLEYAINKMLDNGRAESALELAGDPKASLPSSLLVKVLQSIVNLGDKRQLQVMDEFYIGHIFKQIYQRNELPLEEIAIQEVPFLAIAEGIRTNSDQPLALHKMFQNDPKYFVQTVTYIYKKDNAIGQNIEEKVDDQTYRRSRAARRAIESWKLIPGSHDGMIDEKIFMEWIENAIKLAGEEGFLTGALLEIAKIIARTPYSSEGTWPIDCVCQFIENQANSVLDEQIEVEIYNMRGVTTRNTYDGGLQERDLAKKYSEMSRNIKSPWPRTARILESVASSYLSDSRRMDIDAELKEIEYG